MRRFIVVSMVPLMLAACSDLPLGLGGQGAEPEAPAPLPEPVDATAPVVAPPPVAPPRTATASPAALDTVSEAEKAAARAAAEAAPTGGALGEVTVALGDPVDPGLWVKSGLVTSEQPGTVRTGDGDAIAVTLRPLGDGDGGAQISLPALRALGLPITGLHPVTLSAT